MQSKPFGHALLEEAFVNGHELSDESLEVVDGLLPHLEAVLVISRDLRYLRLELAVTVRHEFLQQTLQHVSKIQQTLKHIVRNVSAAHCVE